MLHFLQRSLTCLHDRGSRIADFKHGFLDDYSHVHGAFDFLFSLGDESAVYNRGYGDLNARKKPFCVSDRSLFFFKNKHGAQILQPNCGRILCDPGRGCTQVNIFLNVDFLLENCLTDSSSRPLCRILIFRLAKSYFIHNGFQPRGSQLKDSVFVFTLAPKFFSLLTTQSLFTSIQFSAIKTVCRCVCLFSFVVVFRNAKPCCILPVSVVTLDANGFGEQHIFLPSRCFFFFFDEPPKPRALFLEAFPFQEGLKPTVLVP